MQKNIVLIGMPGAGKSTIGVLLAKTLGMPFTDTDLIIQQNTGQLLQQIINSKGIDYFITIEEKETLKMKPLGHVIATGGSVVYSPASMQHLQKYGTLVYLALSCAEIERRIMNITTRGIALQKGQSLADLYKERTPLYERYAGITIDCSDKHPEMIVGEICEKIKKISSVCINRE